MIPTTAERLTFYWIQADEHHAADHLFSVDERGCVEDVVTAVPGYIELRKRTVDQACEHFVEAKSSVDLFMLHRALAAEYAVRGDERYSMAEIIEAAQNLIAAEAPQAPDCEVCHGRVF